MLTDCLLFCEVWAGAGWATAASGHSICPSQSHRDGIDFVLKSRISMSRAGHSLLPLAKMSLAASVQRALWRWGGEKASVSVMEPHQRCVNKTQEKHPLAHDFQLVSDFLHALCLTDNLIKCELRVEMGRVVGRSIRGGGLRHPRAPSTLSTPRSLDILLYLDTGRPELQSYRLLCS